MAIQLIFERIGSIEKISPIYKTPALGFDGDDFLNCVIQVHSNYSVKKILQNILSIEKKIGRIRDQSKGYAARIIDIDILFFNDEIINTKNLIVPHLEIQNRKFVLQPLADIAPHLVHPKLNKSIHELLTKTKDISVIEKQSKWLQNPIKNYSISKYRYIAIEGNIGAGKTSLSTILASHFNAKLILERFKENPFLPKFYKKPKRYAFPLEMSFLADRYQQLLEDITQLDLFNECIIADYDAYKSLIFAQITLQEEEYALYKKLFHFMHKELPKPDLYIYLYQNTERLLKNIKKRGRKFETGIEASYLEKINTGYLEFIKNQHNKNIKIIDVSKMDFVNNREDYLNIIKEIKN